MRVALLEAEADSIFYPPPRPPLLGNSIRGPTFCSSNEVQPSGAILRLSQSREPYRLFACVCFIFFPYLPLVSPIGAAGRPRYTNGDPPPPTPPPPRRVFVKSATPGARNAEGNYENAFSQKCVEHTVRVCVAPEARSNYLSPPPPPPHHPLPPARCRPDPSPSSASPFVLPYACAVIKI